MGLKLTLEAKYNHMSTDFIDAYWNVSPIKYDTEYIYFYLQAYPSRDASQKSGQFIQDRLSVGGSEYSTFQPGLYRWETATDIKNIFPEGIPLDPDQQKSAIYDWIKDYTKLPFEDVFEEGQN